MSRAVVNLYNHFQSAFARLAIAGIMPSTITLSFFCGAASLTYDSSDTQPSS